MNEHEIVKRLEYCIENKCDICQSENGSGFPWIDGRCYGFTERLYDVLALLEARVPLEPIHKREKYGWFFYCPKCKTIMNGIAKPKYCSNCGQAVKWDG